MSAPSLPDVAGNPVVRDLIRRAIHEDVGAGDATTAALVPAGARALGRILARRPYVVSGTTVAATVFRELDPGAHCRILIPDGEAAGADAVIMTIAAAAGPMLTAERTALNFMQRMSGIASRTRQFVERVAPHGTTILDTRKTTPTLRVLEKYAVRCGGGTNHRFGLYDMALLKDNHRALWRRDRAADLAEAVRCVRHRYPGMPVEVEVESLDELRDAVRERPEWILLDNMTPALLAECVKVCAGRCRLEASGGVTLENVADVAATGVDAISVGGLTHSAPAADLSLEIEPA